MFGWEYPPHITGGLGTACFGLTKSLASFHDIDLTFVVPKLFGDENKAGMKLIAAADIELENKKIRKHKEIEKKKRWESYQQISAYCSPELYDRLLREKRDRMKKGGHNPSHRKLEFSGQYGTDLFDEISRYGFVASEIAEKGSYDIIHAHDWLTYKAGIEAKKVTGKPLVIHVHATEFDRCGMNLNQGVFEIERTGMETADKVITVSHFTRNTVIRKYGISPLKVVTVHNGVEPLDTNENRETWKIRTQDKIVTYLGRITSQKGPEYFIEAAYKILKRMDNIRFVMAGGGDMLQKMIEYVAKLGISDKFHFTGFLKGNDVYRMYATSDVYVMPSVSEPFGIAPLEAMQGNVPVIISKQSGVSEVLTHAIKIDFWDTDAMADAIHGIISYPVLSDFLKNHGSKEVENIKWSDAAYKIRELYYQLNCLQTG
jgi:glycosyltransferase involved in cell wall biosynthesis